MRTPFVKMQSHNESEPETLRAIVVEKYERCSFCNSKLVFSHDLNLSYLQVVETGQCPGCGVAIAPKKFTLQ